MTLVRWQDAQRALWNAAHAQRMERLKRKDGAGRRWLTCFDQQKELTQCRAEFEWLREVPQMFQANMLSRLDASWKDFFAKAKGLPRFKSKARGDWTPMGVPARECKRVSRKRIRFPKIGDIRIRGHRGIVGKPLIVAITREVDQWFVSVTCRITEAEPVHANPDGVIGLDMGIAAAVADSAGNLVENPRHLEKSRKLLTRAQRQLARKPKRKQSNRKDKAKKRIARIYQLIRRQRTDFLHALSNRYAKSHGIIAIEDLRVQGMTRSAKGTTKAPGRKVRQKSGLNRSALDVGWCEFRRQLTYKAERDGGIVVPINPRNTSRMCSECGVVDVASRRSQSEFRCVACDHEDNADLNAARNIAAAAIASSAGATPVAARGGKGRCKGSRRDANQAPSLRAG